MLYPSLNINLIVFGCLGLIFNAVSLVVLLKQKKGKSLRDNAGSIPLFVLLLIDIGLTLILAAPVYSLTTEDAVFDWFSCDLYGGADMALSLCQFLLTCFIAFDRYISTIGPKWGKWRCHSNYWKLSFFLIFISVLWSFIPVLGYGKYDQFLNAHFCSLDWKQGDIEESGDAAAQRYIAFLTATCLIFFLIPVCTASSFYYSIVDHVERQSSSESREDPNNNNQSICSWAPKSHVAKIGFGCLLSSTVPSLAYAMVCLNPMKSDFIQPSSVIVPVIVSRISAILNPILYIWLNPDVVPIDAWVARRMPKRRPPPAKTYHTINLMMNVPGMSFPILTPTMPRRQLPQIPPHLVSPSRRPVGHADFLGETSPMLL